MCNIIKNIKSILKGKIYIIRNFADSQLCSRCPTTYCPPVQSTCTCTPNVVTTNHSTVLSPHQVSQFEICKNLSFLKYYYN